MNALFVTGSGTDIGKTYVSCALLAAWRQAGRRAGAFKPVASGFDPEQIALSDPALLLGAMGVELTSQTLNAISPWRFRAPLAPPLAAIAEGRRLDFGDILAACRTRMDENHEEVLLIEGAGGIMAPLTETHTALDLAAALATPLLYVAGTYLGAVSHTLTGLAVARQRGGAVAALVLSQSASDDVGLAATQTMIAQFHPDLPIFLAPRGPSRDWATALSRYLVR